MSNNMKDVETEEITKVTKKILEKNNSNITVEEVDVLPGCQPTGNFVSEVFRIKVKGKSKSNGIINDWEKSFILKKLPSPNSLSHTYHDCIKMFNNEISAYENILPKIKNYLDELSENSVEKLNFPEYLGQMEKRFLILQDLKEEGYQVVNLVKGYNTAECNIILEHLAKFHAASFALKLSDKAKLDSMKQEVEETNFRFGNPPRDKMISLWEISLCLAIISLRDSKDPHLLKYSKILEKFAGQVFIEMIDRVDINFFPMHVFCHGDLWTNNILLKYDESKNYPVSVKFIDFQGMRYSSFALDVVQFLCTSANPQKNFLKFFIHYYSALKKNLARMNLEPPFSLDDFLQEIQDKLTFGIFYAFLLFTSLTNKPIEIGYELIIDFASSGTIDLGNIYKELKPEYHERVRGLISAIIESKLTLKMH